MTVDQEAQLAAQEAKVLMTKADRRAILGALARDVRRLSRRPTEKQVAKQGFVSSRTMERAEAVAAYRRIRDIDPDKLPARIVEVRGGSK